MAFNYMRIIGDFFPDVKAETIPGGDFENYNDVIFISGFVSQVDLEDAEANPPGPDGPDNRSVVYIDQGGLNVDEFIKWDGGKFVSEAVTGGGVDRRMIEIAFGHPSGVENKWVGLFLTDKKASNEVPFLAPFDLTLKAITYTNQQPDTETDIEIWRTPVGDEPFPSGRILLHTAEIRAARSVVVAGLNLQIGGGDKVAMFLKKTGGDKPIGPVITLWCEATNPVAVNSVDNYESWFDIIP